MTDKRVPFEIMLDIAPEVQFAMAADRALASEFAVIVREVISEEILEQTLKRLNHRINGWCEENRDRIRRAAIHVVVEQ